MQVINAFNFEHCTPVIPNVRQDNQPCLDVSGGMFSMPLYGWPFGCGEDAFANGDGQSFGDGYSDGDGDDTRHETFVY